MMRLDIIRKFEYRPNFEPAEDYDLFERMGQQYKIKNLNEYLVWYRVHATNVSSTKASAKLRAEREIIGRQLQRLNIIATERKIDLHHGFMSGSFKDLRFSINEYKNWLKELKEANFKTQCYPRGSFNLILSIQVIKLLIAYKNTHVLRIWLLSFLEYKTFPITHFKNIASSSLFLKWNKGKEINIISAII
jgi:hypothetical protein